MARPTAVPVVSDTPACDGTPEVNLPTRRNPKTALFTAFIFVAGAVLPLVAIPAHAEDPTGTTGQETPGGTCAGEHSAIRVGEELKFEIRWGVVRAGTATMEITDLTDFEGHPCYHVNASAESNSVFDKIYPVRDTFESLMDVKDLRSWAFKKHLREGKFRRDQVVRKDHAAGKAYYHDGEVSELVPGSYDVLSAFYFVRTLSLNPDEEFYLDSHSDHKNYPIKVNVLGREQIEVPAGKFPCVIVEPTLREGAFFKNEGSLRIWLTDDEQRMPVQMKSRIPVGAITVVLYEYTRPGQATMD